MRPFGIFSTPAISPLGPNTFLSSLLSHTLSPYDASCQANQDTLYGDGIQFGLGTDDCKQKLIVKETYIF
jgi:hypothetical protein